MIRWNAPIWPVKRMTRPLGQEEIKAQGWSTTDLCFDSRKLLHYVRLLPDDRFMFGGRGGWDASEKGKARYCQMLWMAVVYP